MNIVNFHQRKIDQIESEMVELNDQMVRANDYLVRLKALISDMSEDLRSLYDEKEGLENEYLAQLVIDRYGELDYAD